MSSPASVAWSRGIVRPPFAGRNSDPAPTPGIFSHLWVWPRPCRHQQKDATTPSRTDTTASAWDIHASRRHKDAPDFPQQECPRHPPRRLSTSPQFWELLPSSHPFLVDMNSDLLYLDPLSAADDLAKPRHRSRRQHPFEPAMRFLPEFRSIDAMM